jgi:hypothetical protein
MKNVSLHGPGSESFGLNPLLNSDRYILIQTALSRLPETGWVEARDGIEPPRRSADPSPFVSASAPSPQQLIASRVEETRAVIYRVPFHKVPPRKNR